MLGHNVLSKRGDMKDLIYFSMAALALSGCGSSSSDGGDGGAVGNDAGMASHLMPGAPCAVDPTPSDLDGDMIDDVIERRTGTNPVHPDTDGDGIVDGCEDFDRDGVVDPGEMNPRENDTDGDCIPDGAEDKDGDGEVGEGETNPVGRDSDGDGITDGLEDSNCNGEFEDRETNPLSTDTDGDGFEDGAEDANVNGMVDTRETDPRYADTDRDGLPDSIEDTNGDRVLNPGETDPLNPDSDGDGVYDGSEDRNANGEQDEGELDPGDSDSDDDGIVDGLEDRNGDGIYQVPGEGDEFSGETDGLNPDTDGDGLIDGLDEDRNGNGQVDPGENNPRVVDVNDGSPQVQICATRHLTPIEIWDSPRHHARLALPSAVFDTRRELSTGGIAVGLAYADVEQDRDVHAFMISRSPNDQVMHAPGGRRAFTQAQQDVAAITNAGFEVSPGSPRVFTTADEYEAAVVVLQLAAPGVSALQARNQIASALAPGVVGLPVPGGEPQSGNYRMVMSEIYRSSAQVITLFAIAPVTDDRELEGQRGIASENLAGGSNLAGDNAEIARHCGYSPISRSSSVDFLWIVDNSGSMRQEQDAVMAAARSMVDELDRANLDWRLAVTTTDGSGTIRGGGFTSSGDEFIQRVNVGIGGNPREVGLISGRRAIANLLPRAMEDPAKLRFETPLVIVFLSDEEDTNVQNARCRDDRQCVEQNIAEFIEFYRGETNDYRSPVGFDSPGPVFSIINLPNFDCRGVQNAHSYDLLAIETGGRSESICGRDGNLDYTELMGEIAQTAAGIASDYPIQERPIATTFKAGIQHNDEPVRVLARSRRDGFDYDVTQNRLIIYGNQDTQDGDQLWASYRYWLPPRCMIEGCPNGQSCNKEEDRCTDD